MLRLRNVFEKNSKTVLLFLNSYDEEENVKKGERYSKKKHIKAIMFTMRWIFCHCIISIFYTYKINNIFSLFLFSDFYFQAFTFRHLNKYYITLIMLHTDKKENESKRSKSRFLFTIKLIAWHLFFSSKFYEKSKNYLISCHFLFYSVG